MKITHSAALERIARQNGARDWNTLQARLAAAGPAELRLNDPVRGRYLGQPFTGRIVALSKMGSAISLAIDLDRPVDTIRFEGLSNLRRHIRGTIGRDGRSSARTSDGVPQLVVELGES